MANGECGLPSHGAHRCAVDPSWDPNHKVHSCCCGLTWNSDGYTYDEWVAAGRPLPAEAVPDDVG